MVDKQAIPDIAPSTVAHNRDLRDRIAAVIEETICGHWEEGFGVAVADAVIAELGLTKEDEYNPYDPFPPPYRVRYVTEWEKNDG